MTPLLWAVAALVVLGLAAWPADRYLDRRRARRREAARRRLDAWLTQRHGFTEADLAPALEAHRAGAQALAEALDRAVLYGTRPPPTLGEATVIEALGYPPRPPGRRDLDIDYPCLGATPPHIDPPTVTLEAAALDAAIDRHPAGRRRLAPVVELEPRRPA